MISLHNITNIENKQEPLFDDEEDSPIIRKIILHKEQNTLIINGEIINRYGIFIDRNACELLDGTRFDGIHHFSFKNEELYIELDSDIDLEDEDDDEFGTIKIFKYHIEGKEGLFWLIIENYFWMYGDNPEENAPRMCVICNNVEALEASHEWDDRLSCQACRAEMFS